MLMAVERPRKLKVGDVVGYVEAGSSPEQAPPPAVPLSLAAHLANWYAIQTNPNAERAVQDQIRLLGHGYTPFFPFCMIRRQRQIGRNRAVVEDVPRPYFSRYVFVGTMPWCDTLGPIHSMQGVAGVVRTVSDDGTFRPLRIKEKQMRELLSRADEDGRIGGDPLTAEPDHPYLPGDIVEHSRNGPFAGFTCTVVRLRKHGMIEIVTEMFGSARPSEIHQSQLGDVLKRDKRKRA